MTTTHDADRITDTTPVCPAWCTVTREEHEEEARDSHGSWFSHRTEGTAAARPADRRAPVTVHLSQLQMFDEQADYPEENDAAVIVDGLILEPTEARRLAAALTSAADLLEGGAQ